MRENLKNILIISGAVAVYFLWVWSNSNLFAPTRNLPDQPKVLSTETGDWLEIPKLEISAPIVYAESADEDAMQAGLSSGVVHYPNTAKIGQVGNCYLVGHSSDYPQARGDYKEIFARLPELMAGDEILISAGDKRFRYVILYTQIVEPEDLSVLSQETGGRKLLTLQTSYPVGRADKRFLAVAELE